LVRDPDPGEAPHPIFGWPLGGRLLVPTPVPPNPKFKEAGKRNCSTPQFWCTKTRTKTPGCVSSIKRFPFGRGGFPEVQLTETSTGLSNPPGEASADPLVVRFPLPARAWATNEGKRVCVNKRHLGRWDRGNASPLHP